jgi:prophage antirepressor-like protein
LQLTKQPITEPQVSADLITRNFIGMDTTFPVRILELNGQRWFVAMDVLASLAMDTRQSANYLRYLSEDEMRVVYITQGKGNPNKAFIPESGLYKLIMRSDKPQTRAFQDWVARDVLPAIRKGGACRPL